MMSRLIAITLCGLTSAPAAIADDKPAEEKKAALVTEINLKGLKVGRAGRGDPTKPTMITTAEALAKAFPDADAQAAIKKDVDFSKQELALFAWEGSGGDNLAFTVDETKKPPHVKFTLKRGLSRDLRSTHESLCRAQGCDDHCHAGEMRPASLAPEVSHHDLGCALGAGAGRSSHRRCAGSRNRSKQVSA